jgi:hypothetical protein
MKLGTIITTFLLTISLVGQAYAAAPSPTQSPSQTEANQINQLKNKIASQVSQLKLVEKRGIIGTIQDANSSQITLLDIHSQLRYIDLDEITKYTDADGSSLDVTDMKKGMEISVFGIYNKDSQRILARYISVEVVPTRFYGEITQIDKPNFQITVMTTGGKTEKAEIDTTSTVSSYSGGTSLSTYGFSKLSQGDRVEVIGYPDKTTSSLIIVDRMIDYVTAPKDPQITFATPTPTQGPAPTSKGAKSISPIK